MYSVGSQHWLLVKDFNIQYRSTFVMIRWVYPQIIVIWLICMMFMENMGKVKHYVLLIAPILIYGTFSIVFMAVAGIIYAVYYIFTADDNTKRKICLKNIFSIYNIGSCLTLGIVFITYFVGYLQVEKPQMLKMSVHELTFENLFIVLIFDLFMFGIYAICVYKECKREPLYYWCIIFLLVLPFFKMGLYNDIVMSASVPALFYIMIYVIRLLNNKNDNTGNSFRCGIVAVILFIGAWYPWTELTDIIREPYLWHGVMDYYTTLENFTDRDSDEAIDLIYNYFTYEPDDKFFYKYLSKPGENE